ncbi:restriction endonuclease subunit S [Citrobacter portucalensis]|uniref:restriction endonuclease subunit S n=1 Tax=Citrobacter portucalensis TaxID=1639133 RepID=UPI002B3E75F1|nr:restriction endonuclease subunit S [Citrobacter portucalensis]MEB2719850.1 restriction endonuclease subunit S [Citrobacter portucalensis]
MISTYPTYKRSDIEWMEYIPSHWDELKGQFLLRKKDCNVGDAWISTQLLSLTQRGVIKKDINSGKGKTHSDYSTYQFVENGDLIFCLFDIDETPRTVGLSSFEGMITSAYSVFEAINGNDKKYLYYFFEFVDNCKGLKPYYSGMRKTVRPTEFLKILLPKPPKTEQKAIATFLDRETQRIDSLIEEKQTFIKLLKEKRQALINHVVTKGLNPNVEMQDSGIEWIGQVPKHWVVKKIKYDVLGIEQGWSPQCESTPVPDDHTWGVVKVGCVNRGIFNPEQNKKLPEELEPRKEYTIKKGDLLVSRANAKEWVGSAAVPDRDYDNLLLCDKIYRIKLDLEKADPEFFAYYLASDQAREQIEIDATGTSSSMLNIGQGTILNMPIPAPELPEQQSIVQGIKNKTSQIDRLMLEVLDSIELLKEHRTSLISAVVTGKIDVREAV